MPRKKKTIVEETLPDVNDVTNADGDLADIVCVLTKVYKINVGSRSFCYQTTEPVDEVSIQGQYPAGGKFVVISYNAMNDVINTVHIDIEPKPLTSNGNGASEDIRTRMLLEELAFTRNMMLQMINGVFSNKTQATATPLGELAQAMQVVHGMSPQTNSADLILKGMELGMKANGSGGDWKTALVDTAKEIAPVVVQAFSAAKQVQQGQTQMIALPPAMMLKQGLDWLKPRIISGMEPDLAVNWVITNANDPMCQQLLTHAAQGLDAFITADPEIANEPFKTWFTTAIQQLKDWYAAQSANQDDNERGIGDDSDVTDNENISSGKSTVRKIG